MYGQDEMPMVNTKKESKKAQVGCHVCIVVSCTTGVIRASCGGQNFATQGLFSLPLGYIHM